MNVSTPIEDVDIVSSPSEQSQLVENYAHIRSLPEFKAFKLNQEGQPDSRFSRRRNTTTDSPASNSANKEKPEYEWMEEIRVTRRTKKQAYLRSGTHDFCIRLYSMDKKKD